MVAGLYKRSQIQPGSDSAPQIASSSLVSAATTATTSLSLGWRFPLRGDSLTSGKTTGHHIVHSSMKDGIDQLKDYLRSESQLNSGLPSTRSAPHTPLKANIVPAVANSVQGLGIMQTPNRAQSKTLDRSIQQPDVRDDSRSHGLRSNTHGPSVGSRRNRLQDLFGFMDHKSEDIADVSSTHLIASPPPSREASCERRTRDMLVLDNAGSGEVAVLEAQSPPQNLAASSPYLAEDRNAFPESSLDCTDANTIISMYTDEGVEDVSSISDIPDSSGPADESSSGSLKDEEGGAEQEVPRSDSLSSPARAALDGSPMLNAMGILDDEDFFDAASIPLPTTPSTIHSANAADNEKEPPAAKQTLREKSRSRMSMQQELRQKLMRCMQDEYTVSLQSQELRATSMIQKAKENCKRLLAKQEVEFSQRLAEQQEKHEKEMSICRQETESQIASLLEKISEISLERNELQGVFDEYMSTSGELLKQKEAENSSLAHELAQLALKRQRLQKKLEDSKAHALALANERREVQERVDALTAENMRLEHENNSLSSDVLVGEERSAKIKSYAEGTLCKANEEIARLQRELERATSETTALRARAARADTRARSLQIQLDSVKQQNEELLALCERAESPPPME
ncbi:hypothetical protein GGI07_002126 [Coemansia sp. Benny D115]|nr:hypothetical protein GGI07_002126 [Coemansia sp. Benny D115]